MSLDTNRCPVPTRQYVVSTGSSSSVATSYCGQQLLKPDTNGDFLSYFLQKGKHFRLHTRRPAATKVCHLISEGLCRRKTHKEENKTKKTNQKQHRMLLQFWGNHPESTVMASWRAARTQPPVTQLVVISWGSYPRVMPTILLAGKLRLSKFW